MNSWMTEYHQIEQYHNNLKSNFIAETQFLFPYSKPIDGTNGVSTKRFTEVCALQPEKPVLPQPLVNEAKVEPENCSPSWSLSLKMIKEELSRNGISQQMIKTSFATLGWDDPPFTSE